MTSLPTLIPVKVGTYFDYADRLGVPWKNEGVDLEQFRRMPRQQRYGHDVRLLYTYRSLGHANPVHTAMAGHEVVVVLASYAPEGSSWSTPVAVADPVAALWPHVRFDWVFDPARTFEDLLDWFHITMRITVMTTMAKSLRPSPPDPEFPAAEAIDPAAEVGAELKRLKRFLWHGNVFRALQTVQDLEIDLDVEEPSVSQAKLLKAVREFDGYLRANAGRIPNYGERRRAGEAIS